MIDRWLATQTFFLQEQTVAMENIKKTNFKLSKPLAKAKPGELRCEWNPLLKCPAWRPRHEGDCINRATMTVGGDEKWHICASCASLPEFNSFIQESLMEV